MSFILGLDAGGTKTLALLADRDGRIVGSWTGPGLDPLARRDWADGLAEAVHGLLAGRPLAAAVIGLPCHGEIADITAAQQAAAAGLFACSHLVLNDVEVAFDGAFAGGDGILLLAGTGSMAWGRSGGVSLRVGGWGEAFGDEGSAFWIGQQALALTAQTLDGRADGHAFSAAILAACDTDATGLAGWIPRQANPRAACAALARHVDDLAAAGDLTASFLLHQAARRLADHVVAARRRLGVPDLRWSHAGGVFASRRIRARTSQALGLPMPPLLPPAGGALLRAAGLAHWPVDDGFIHALGQVPASPTRFRR